MVFLKTAMSGTSWAHLNETSDTSLMAAYPTEACEFLLPKRFEKAVIRIQQRVETLIGQLTEDFGRSLPEYSG